MNFMTKIKNRQKTKILALIAPLTLGGVGGGLFTACSDWDDHYDADTAITGSQQSTLLENITKRPELSQFAALLSKTGFDEQLGGSQTYTVWAPVNDSFDYDALMATHNDRVLRQFVQNHVARNNYPATGVMDQKIFMLNEKMMFFQGAAGDYKIGDILLAEGQENIGSRNGTLHLINKDIPYLYNIFESLNNEQFAIDSISSYFHHYNDTVLNEARSTPGPIVDGEQTYLDSIVTEDNTLYRTYHAFINREDSNYTMVVPTNEAWTKTYQSIEKFYKYPDKFQYISATEAGKDTTINVTIRNAKQLRDSITKYMLVSDLFFNNKLYDNKKLNDLQQGETATSDSLVTTLGSILYGEDVPNLFAGATRVDKSNGALWVTNQLNLPSWSAWNPEITIEAESYWFMTANAASPTTQHVVNAQGIKGRISNDRYIEISPNTPGAHPEIYFALPNVRSAEYNVYLVMVPSNISNPTAECKYNSISAGFRYAKEDGVLDKEGTQQNANPNEYERSSTFVTHGISDIDTLFIGSVTFPMSYYGLGNFPYLRVRSRFASSLESQLPMDRTLRIDCIVLRPKELDDYLQTHPGYKYDKHNNN